MTTETETFDAAELPQTFTDTDGNAWRPSVLLPDAKRVREAEGLQGYDLYSMKDYGGLLADWNVAATVLYYCSCFDKDNEARVPLETWQTKINADIIETGVYALGRALIDFFPRSRRKEAAATVEKLQAFQSKAKAAAERIAASPIFEAAVDADLAKIEATLEAALQNPAGLSTQSLANAIDALDKQD